MMGGGVIAPESIVRLEETAKYKAKAVQGACGNQVVGIVCIARIKLQLRNSKA